MMAYFATRTNSEIPHNVREALQDAMEISVDNVPEINGKTHICIDTSGSMGMPITGYRAGSTTSVTCVDVAALFGASLLRKNRDASVVLFDTHLITGNEIGLNARDTVLTNAAKMARNGGGTNCSLPLADLNRRNAQADAVIYVSDNQSWIDSVYGRFGNTTGMQAEWTKFTHRNRNAKLICIDLTPNPASQVKERPNILQVGGFSDQVFEVVASFVEHGDTQDHWVKEIEKISLEND